MPRANERNIHPSLLVTLPTIPHSMALSPKQKRVNDVIVDHMRSKTDIMVD